MAITYLFGTGFEAGSMEIFSVADQAKAYIYSDDSHTGTYSVKLDPASIFERAWIQWPLSTLPSDVYTGVWLYPENCFNQNGELRVEAVLDDAKVISVRLGYLNWDIYIDDVLSASGTQVIQQAWQLIEVHFVIDDSSGSVTVRVDGAVDATFTGDTKPSTGTSVEYIRIWNQNEARNPLVDDWTICTGGWPGDMRYDLLAPEADTATADWTCSTGTDNYDLVNDAAPNDAEYVYTSTNGHQDLYDLPDWTGSGKLPRIVVQWCRAWQTAATGEQIKLMVYSGSTLDQGSAENLLTDEGYFHRILDDDPDTSAEWTESAIDALQIGQESVI